MAGGFAAYMARFSGKTRSTLRRKAKKLAEETGGFTVTEHRTQAEIEAFLAAALPLSARTYRARLLDAGLPDSPQARRSMLEAAEGDRMRGFLLHAAGQAIAYLSLPVVGPKKGGTLVYAHLGYDPSRPARCCRWKRWSGCLPRNAIAGSISPKGTARTRRCSEPTARLAPA